LTEGSPKYTKIDNDVLEALRRTNLSAYQARVIFTIWRKTWGFHKDADWIGLDQFVEDTRIKKPHISRALRELKARNIITYAGNKISFNKDYTAWRALPIQVTTSKITYPGNGVTYPGNGVTYPGNESLPIQVPTKERKENIQKKLIQKKVFMSDSIEIGLSEKLLSLILKRNENFKKPNLQSWAQTIDKMIRLDNRVPEKISSVIEWCQGDPFWQNNILSTQSLRDKFDRLALQMGSGASRVNKKTGREPEPFLKEGYYDAL
jgi:phage replication O-like protein O